MNDEAALLQAIRAQPDEDIPRLAYADWLEENGGPLQAEFIRSQCRFSGCSPSDTSYPDAWEHHKDIVARCCWWIRYTSPTLPPGFGVDYSFQPHDSFYQRGFLYIASGTWQDRRPTDEDIDLLCRGLPRVLAETTVRMLHLSGLTPSQLARILNEPGVEALTGLAVRQLTYNEDEGDELARVVAGARALAGLKRLRLDLPVSAAGCRTLAVPPFPSLTRFDLPILNCDARAVRRLIRARFRGLCRVRVVAPSQDAINPLLARLANLTSLTWLDLEINHEIDPIILTRQRAFPALTALRIWGRAQGNAPLASARFPKLSHFVAEEMESSAFVSLLGARWFDYLQVLGVLRGSLDDDALVALSRSPVAATLRMLGLSGHRIGIAGFAALADGMRFPNLTTLEFNQVGGTTPSAPEVRAVVRQLGLRLRFLELIGWPLKSGGAKALGANPALAGLKMLRLSGCDIGDSGAKALLDSSHLQNLVELNLDSNKIRSGADALTDREVMPCLGVCRLDGNAIPKDSVARLKLRHECYLV